MLTERLLVHRVTVGQRGTATDEYGNTTRSGTTTETANVPAWMYQQSAPEQRDSSADRVVGRWRVITNSSLMSAADYVAWNGVTFEVVSGVERVSTPRGVDHYEADLRRVQEV